MPSDPSPLPFQGRHFEFIQQALPGWIKGSTPERIRALKATGLKSPAPYPNASTEQHRQLKTAIAEHWRAQTALDKRLGPLNDLQAFAEPLLKHALLADYGDVDVRNTWLRVYVEAKHAWWVLNVTGAVQSRTLSLLELALHNFAASERFVDYAFMGPEDARGQRDIVSIHHRVSGKTLTAEQFKDLCRSLDIGKLYQARLNAALGGHAPAVARSVRDEVIAGLRADLRSAAHLARHNDHLHADACAVMLAFIDNHRNLQLDGQCLGCYHLSLLGSELTGILLFAPAPEGSTPTQRILAWVPHDPEHPLKQYPSPVAFVQELTRQLRDTAGYQGFFSQFVDHRERGAFFATLNSRLASAAGRPHLQFSVQDITQDQRNRAANPAQDDPWSYLYRVKLNKILNDARELAVSTDYVERLARWAWWDNLEKIFSDVLNVALLVVTPFVPVLGQLMLAYSAYQVCDEVFEGVVDWAQGHGEQAAEHVLGVAQSLIQLAAFGAAGKIGEVVRPKLSAFVEGLHPVQRADGQLKLWNPDLAPYAQQNLDQGNPLLPLADQHFEVRHAADLDQQRIVHPTRADAYQPQVLFNGDGAFVHEGEVPQSWDSQTLMRRLGPRVQGFTDAQLEQLRIASGTDEGVLRSMYRYNKPMPPLLATSLRRLEAQAYPQAASRRIRAGQPLALDSSSDWFPQIVTELPGWPEDKAIEVFLDADVSGSSQRFGNPEAAPADTLSLSLTQALSGTLPDQVLGFLDEAAVRSLLGGDVAAEQRVQALRNQLADRVLVLTPGIADKVYQTWEINDEPGLSTLRQPFAHLDTRTARTLFDSATEHERQALDQRQLPLRLHNQARELDFAACSVRAFEGLAQPSPLPMDTERLALNTLKFHSDTFAQLRIEIREHNATGALRCQAGPERAATTRILLRSARGYALSGPSAATGMDLYEALLEALPDDRRDALGYAPGQGDEFKAWLTGRVESLAERRKVLAKPPTPLIQDRQTSALLGGPAVSRCTCAPIETDTAHARLTLQLLFPRLSEQRLGRFLEQIPATQLNRALNGLVQEKQLLHVDLQTWQNAPNTGRRGSIQDRTVREARRRVASALERCWADRYAQYTDGWGDTRHGAQLELTHSPLPAPLPVLATSFEHVTYLDLTNSHFSELHSDFLKLFPSLRALNLADNLLTRLPPALAQMRFLRDVKLSGNRLELSADEVAWLKKLRRLKSLDLSNNPLSQAPDITQMPGLRLLYLSGTPLTTWPEGLFAHSRGDRFVLDLRGTRIANLPTVEADSPQARLIARARLNRRALTEEQQVLYERYRIAAGLDPNRTYEPVGDNKFWLQGMETSSRQDSQRLWTAVEQERGSQGFFEVIQSLETAENFETDADQQRFAHNRPLLTERVWRMLRAAHDDSDLRERLFRMASFPGLCPDAGAQIFNEMGIEVLANEASRYSTSNAQREARLVTLARGSARLRHLSQVVGEEIARRLRPVAEGGLGQRLRSDMRGSVPGKLDEVDVHLAYQTSLAERLDLPWLADHMLYRRTADVSPVQLEQAYEAVLGLGNGDGLVNQMLLEPWWEQYLREAHDDEYRGNEQLYDTRLMALDELPAAQSQWANAKDLAEPERQRLRDTLKTLAETLEVPESVVFADEAMTDERYNRLLNDLGYNEKEWMRRLTRQALNTAVGYTNRGRDFSL
jgi:hypothetical protein